MRVLARTCWSVIVGLLLTPGAIAQESVTIRGGDLLSVQVFREDQLSTKVRVRDGGSVLLPLIGSVAVAGLPPAEAAARIADAYLTGHFLTHPEVTLLIEESALQQVAVLGEVGRPGTVALSSPRSLIDVLSEAGGLLKSADHHVTIRRPDEAPITVLVGNQAASVLNTADVLVRPGDTVLVPRAGIVYVLGDVGRPGGYLMEDDSRLSVLQALALAGGTTKTAAEGEARLIRGAAGNGTEIPLHLKAVQKGKAPDLSLENDDILYVPFSFGKNLALGAASVAASASSAVIYAAY